MTRTALVLGGGGITGIAWELGILHGLAEAGIDLTGADTVVGTSAGSVVGMSMTTESQSRSSQSQTAVGLTSTPKTAPVRSDRRRRGVGRSSPDNCRYDASRSRM